MEFAPATQKTPGDRAKVEKKANHLKRVWEENNRQQEIKIANIREQSHKKMGK